MSFSLGIDFGTTNSVLAIANADGSALTVKFTHDGVTQTVFPTALCFWEDFHAKGRRLKVEAGPWAIAQFISGEEQHRFIQSFKSFAASNAFRETRIFSKPYQFEDLLSVFMQALLKHWNAPQQMPGHVVIGRPVTFAGASPDDALAMQRYRNGFSRLGWDKAAYVYEPVGAAFHYARQLQQDATVLIADFGGGTSDFSIIRFSKQSGKLAAKPLAHCGIGIAGDTFDYRIIDKVVSPRLGKGGSYRSFDKLLTIPNGYYTNFARWNFLALMKSSGELRELHKLVKEAVDPEPLRQFIALIENDLGYALYRAVSKTKIALSSSDKALFEFREEGLNVKGYIRRSDFERWIAADVEKINGEVDSALAKAGLAASDIDRVFLTGGSSFIPLLRRQFEDRFGTAKLSTGGEFESIALGLALIGLSSNLHEWSLRD